jgi:viologen exporter family transport system permease protein
VSSNLATARANLAFQGGQATAIRALVGAGFRRYATYRQAMVASCFTNTVFGFLRCYVLLAVTAGVAGGVAAGYHPQQLAMVAWVSQALIGTVALWGWTDLGDRIRSGDVVADLLRPVHPVLAYLAVDLGRAGYAVLTRFVVPMVVGAVFFDLYAPRRLATYPIFAVSAALGVVVCFGCRYLVNAAGYWLLDVRGVNLCWALASSLLVGLAFPLHFLPGQMTLTLWLGTPFPSIMQAPMDVLVERGPVAVQVGLVAGQVGWAVVMLSLCWYVQRRAERRLVVQGG